MTHNLPTVFCPGLYQTKCNSELNCWHFSVYWRFQVNDLTAPSAFHIDRLGFLVWLGTGRITLLQIKNCVYMHVCVSSTMEPLANAHLGEYSACSTSCWVNFSWSKAIAECIGIHNIFKDICVHLHTSRQKVSVYFRAPSASFTAVCLESGMLGVTSACFVAQV